MKIIFIDTDSLKIEHNLGHYIVKKEGKGFGVYQKYDKEDTTYYITNFETIFLALKFLETFIKD